MPKAVFLGGKWNSRVKEINPLSERLIVPKAFVMQPPIVGDQILPEDSSAKLRTEDQTYSLYRIESSTGEGWWVYAVEPGARERVAVYLADLRRVTGFSDASARPTRRDTQHLQP